MEECATLEKMGHTWKSAAHVEEWGALGRVPGSWKSAAPLKVGKVRKKKKKKKKKNNNNNNNRRRKKKKTPSMLIVNIGDIIFKVLRATAINNLLH